MSDSLRTFFVRFCTSLAVMAVAFAFGWALQPKGIEAATTYQREVVEELGPPATSLGMLQGRGLGIRLLPGRNGPRYQVLDEEGLVLGTYDSEAEMVAGFEQLGTGGIRADVSEAFLQDP